MKRPVFSPEQIKSNDDYDMAMATFQYQYEQNSVYRPTVIFSMFLLRIFTS